MSTAQVPATAPIIALFGPQDAALQTTKKHTRQSSKWLEVLPHFA